VPKSRTPLCGRTGYFDVCGRITIIKEITIWQFGRILSSNLHTAAKTDGATQLHSLEKKNILRIILPEKRKNNIYTEKVR
jgi:hypothetical protein